MSIERKRQIIDLLHKEGKVTVQNLSTIFNVSFQTIRRDLEDLEKDGNITKIYGGAVLKNDTPSKFHHCHRATKYMAEKELIAETAINFINNGDIIALNDSTTNIALSKKLKSKFDKLTVVSNSLDIVNILLDTQYDVILTGGVLNPAHNAFYGELALKNLSELAITKAFISVSSVSLKNGLTDYPQEEVEIQKKLIDISSEVYILADSSKFETASLIKVTELASIKCIITDPNIDPGLAKRYKKHTSIIY